MAKSINNVTLLGRAGRDIEMRYTTSGIAVANISIATSVSWKKDGEWEEATEWHNVVAWRDVAEKASHIRKGDRVFVQGSLKTEKWTDKEGNERQGVKINATTLLCIYENEKAEPPQEEPGEPSQEWPDDDIPF